MKTSLQKAWIFTFSDLVSLLVTFFVMLFAMTTPVIPAFETSVSMPRSWATTPSSYILHQDFSKRRVNLEYLYHVLLDKNINIPGFRLQLAKDQLTLSLPISIFSDDTDLSLTATAQEKIHDLGYLLNTLSNRISVLTPVPLDDIERGIAISSALANELKKGGYTDQIPVFAQTEFKSHMNHVDIMIYPYQKERVF